MKIVALSCLGVLALSSAAMAVDVFVISSDNPTIDAAVTTALEAGGNVVTLGPDYSNFTEDLDLSGYDVIYLQSNYNYSNPDMPAGGQAAILDFVQAGGGLVTCEWAEWKAYAQGHFVDLRPVLPGRYLSYTGTASETFTETNADPVLSKGLPDSFDFPLDSYGGTQTSLERKCGAVEYFRGTYGSGVIGWNYGIGRALTISTTNGPTQVADPEFAVLLSNAMKWAALAGGPGPEPHYADCDFSGALDLFDFLCFTNAFNASEEYADCDGDKSFSLFDFLCFVNEFNKGC